MRKWIIIKFSVLAMALLVCISDGLAGSSYEVKCTDPQCGFLTTARTGGGMKFEETGGFCRNCGKWANITWDRGKAKPRSVFNFWDPVVGSVRDIYECPSCRNPFVTIHRIDLMKFCPKCGRPELKATRKFLYD